MCSTFFVHLTPVECLFSMTLLPGNDGKYFSEVHNWDSALHRGCDFGSCPRAVGAAARGGQGLTLLHFSPQPKPFGSVSRFVYTLLKPPNVSHKGCLR